MQRCAGMQIGGRAVVRESGVKSGLKRGVKNGVKSGKRRAGGLDARCHRAALADGTAQLRPDLHASFVVLV